tara:strand:- start:372 stop:1136 length:765 start_codon:yes stop_codon:yes gene_type:complete
MNWWGKLIGTGVGLLGGPVGALAGAALGHLYDEDDPTPQSEQKARIMYLAYFFSCAAKISKADGRVSAEEIQATESIINRMALSVNVSEFVKNVFRKAKNSKRPIENDFDDVGKLIRYDSTVGKSFLGGLFEIVRSNGKNLNVKQQRILLIGEKKLRLPSGLIKSWLLGGYAQANYSAMQNSNSISISQAYNILGLVEDCKDDDVKLSYRKMAADFHPDKLRSKNLPEEFTKFANDQLAKINHAYDTICKVRGI